MSKAKLPKNHADTGQVSEQLDFSWLPLQTQSFSYLSRLVTVLLVLVFLSQWMKGHQQVFPRISSRDIVRIGRSLQSAELKAPNTNMTKTLPAVAGRQGHSTSPKIFVYTLPAELSQCVHDTPQNPWKFFNYGSEIMVPEWIRSSQHITANAEEADFFYVPALIYCIPHGGVPHTGSYKTLAEQTYAWLEANSTYWKRHEGQDHIFTFSQDHGFCGFANNEGTIPGMTNSIILTHWGLKTNEIGCSWAERLANYGHCQTRDFPDQGLLNGTYEPCYTPRKDIVIAHPLMDDWVWVSDQFKDNLTRHVQLGNDNRKLAVLNFTYPQTMLEQVVRRAEERSLKINIFTASLNKTTTLFFNGDTRHHDITYSRGVRQTVYALFKDYPGFEINDSQANNGAAAVSFNEIILKMAQSTFCLALTGAAWGVRLKMSVMSGCIPVVIGEDVEMEFEEVLPYQDFALKIPQHAIYKLPDLLNEVQNQPGRVQAMQHRLNCAWRFLSYNSQYGQAGEALMCSLRHRLYGTDNIWPAMDWDRCTLHCGTLADLDIDKLTSDPEQLSLSDYSQRLQRSQGKLNPIHKHNSKHLTNRKNLIHTNMESTSRHQ